MTVYVVAGSHHDAVTHQRVAFADRPAADVVLLSTRTPLGLGQLRRHRLTHDDQVVWVPGWSHGRHSADLVDYLAALGWHADPDHARTA